MFYVYADIKPSGIPFYIGKGSSKRLTSIKRNKFHSSVTSKYPDWERIVLFEAESENEAHDFERSAIAKIGRRDLGLGPLVNLTDGGEGKAGKIISNETLLKMKSAAKKRGINPEIAAMGRLAKVGKPISEETRKRLSDGIREAYLSGKRERGHTLESKAKISAAKTGRVLSDETKAKMSAAHKGKKYTLGKTLSEEHKQKIRLYSQSEEARSANSERIKAAWASGKFAKRGLSNGQ